MILVAAYPDNFKCYAMLHGAIDFERLFYNSNGYQNSYNKAEKHFNNVSEWCKKCLCGPYELDKEQDLLFDGVRIRLGRESDMVYFQLRWG